jgi:hypothetical protein
MNTLQIKYETQLSTTHVVLWARNATTNKIIGFENIADASEIESAKAKLDAKIQASYALQQLVNERIGV